MVAVIIISQQMGSNQHNSYLNFNNLSHFRPTNSFAVGKDWGIDVTILNIDLMNIDLIKTGALSPINTPEYFNELKPKHIFKRKSTSVFL
ncbi:hypothetical protein CAEBREN_32038 [Caenorhabditis brenneri]|uniref:Uncharacterized protein n=1 Tax=Caenorhabditis brenneri TaxID=135651 RepID=G0PIM3_CAEBE|nr:hypothetical protein CAEBREN_32038 [Caenorhabditis brenneri]